MLSHYNRRVLSSHVMNNTLGLAGGQYQTSSASVRDKFMKDTTTSKSASLESGSDIGSSTTTENMLDLDGVCMPGLCQTTNLQAGEKPIHLDSVPCSTLVVHSEIEDRNIDPMASLAPISASVRTPHKYSEDCTPLHSTHSNCSSLVDDSAINGLSTSPTSFLGAGRNVATNSPQSLDSTMSSKVSNTSIPKIHMEQSETSDSHNSVEFTQYFHEGYCKVSELDDCRELTEAVTDGDSSSSHCEREKPEDGDNDDMLGGVFAFSEEDLSGNG